MQLRNGIPVPMEFSWNAEEGCEIGQEETNKLVSKIISDSVNEGNQAV